MKPNESNETGVSPYKPRIKYEYGTLHVAIDGFDFKEEIEKWLADEPIKGPMYFEHIIIYDGINAIKSRNKKKWISRIIFLVIVFLTQIVVSLLFRMYF